MEKIDFSYLSSVQSITVRLIYQLKGGGFWIVFLLLLLGCQSKPEGNDWEVYKADTYSSSYSSLDQINKDNVDQLEVAWTYRSGDLEEDGYSTMETNPIIVDDVLYGGTPRLNVFALDAETGKELWMYQPFPEDPPRGYMRGVTYWEEGSDKRIFFSAGSYLFALNAETGELVKEFGDGGRVNLNEGLGRDPSTISVKSPSPGIIYKDLIIMGSAVGEGYNSAPGHIRAYNVRTGRQEWIFHTIPQPGELGYDTWEQTKGNQEIAKGGVNNWAGMSLDPERGMVFVPLGSPTYDFYGGDRPGKNLFGNSLVVLDASSGEYIWHYQTVHHDLWDYDLPAPPNLLTVEQNGEEIDAVAQITKTGFTFVFNRETGEPLFEIEERPVPKSNFENENAWPTQPHPVVPEPYIRQNYTRDQVPTLTAEARDSALALFDKYRADGLFTPADPRGTLYYPSTQSGANWGGAAHDPNSGMLYVNANEGPELLSLQRIEQETQASGSLYERGKVFYQRNCATCHGANREGMHPTYPAIANVQDRLTKEEVLNIIEKGGGRMPAFTNITEVQKDAIIAYLYNEKEGTIEESKQNIDKQDNEGGRFINITAYRRLEGPNGLPAIKPPWGTLNAININTGEIEWRIPLGTHPKLADKDIPPTGMESWGGPIVTAGGLLFIGATRDHKFRAFDKDTGELIWETTLPTGGFATPATYMAGGKQYIVIAAGGGRGTNPGDYYVAFVLPDQAISE
ncbi:PQQ-binding-like beta-propeller repeat protein [Aliifodinibius sp. S!AR15-10]|uniref:outer membrane protein assembly factor BamB family protein n=1 Tax=Aliifodinibius sp. S!AR15-10 TaxID=2950437 RepID=UPI00285E1700|nr:PQQ-binding-like beta-propeller repeat protein [Aliifodinibius sp. S!AR15-10]MDR8393567.1 PQQ-binding-like beta-propeller repeat protein [Aliifodinibius sp. S!AR15-10]